MRACILFPASTWNHRRFSKPWIAVVEEWPVGGRPTLRWGGWLGAEGEQGELEIQAEPGDVVKFGQKDYRNRNGTQSLHGIVNPDGSISTVTATEAREAFDRKGQP